MRNKLYEFINRTQGVSYVEIEDFFNQAGFEWKGDYNMKHPKYENVYFWSGWNVEATELLAELEKDGKVYKEPTEQFIYVMDGRKMNMKVATRDYDYKTDHWIPLIWQAK